MQAQREGYQLQLLTTVGSGVLAFRPDVASAGWSDLLMPIRSTLLNIGVRRKGRNE
jgi:hypothetical protein